MKKNVMMRVAAILMVCVLATTCGISGTFAKYVASADTEDTARVAKWGVEIILDYEDDAFAETYENTEDEVIVASSEVDVKVVAPGTSGVLLDVSVEGVPEVAVSVDRTATLVLAGWEIDADDDGDADDEYCPLIFTVTIGGNETVYQIGQQYATVDALVTAINAALSAELTFAPNSNLAYDVVVEWEWPFSTGDANDLLDTKLGDLAAEDNAPTIAFEYSVNIEQTDDLPSAVQDPQG